MNAAVSFPDANASLDAALLTTAFELCPESLAIVENARIVYANPAFADLFGYRHAAELRQRNLCDFLPADRLCTQPDADGLTDCDSTACGYPGCRFEGKLRDGSLLAIEASCTRASAAGRTLLVIAAHDVSQPERRRVVRTSERRFRSIFDASAIGIGHATLDGHIVESNRALESMLGYSRDQLRGLHFRDLFHCDEVAGAAELFADLVAGRRESYKLELRYLRQDRTDGWSRVTLSLVRGPDGCPEFAIAMVEDVTERKRAEQQLREAQKMEAIGRLVGGVAHDFNNLLTGIMLYCDLLMNGLQTGSRLRHHAEEIRMASEHGAALIQQLLAVARQQVVEPRVLSLHELVSGMRNLLARLIGENIELITRLEAQPDSIKIDPAQAQQILLNLVLNARDAMPEGGRITLETRNSVPDNSPSSGGGDAAAGLLLSVTDTGCGMSAETRAHLFEPFFTTKGPGKGNGLGLATVQSAVKQCGGSIDVQSEPGHGTCIRILFPHAEDDTHEVKEDSTWGFATARETVLIVEDDSAVRHSAERLLSEHGYTVLQAANGPDALDVCRSYEGEIHLLLTDMVLPGMSGLQVAQQALLVRPSMQVLYASGYSHAASCQVAGMEPAVLFRKPFNGAALLRKVHQVLSPRKTPTLLKKEEVTP